jgi:ABC-2 type transport system ATP-binding protein
VAIINKGRLIAEDTPQNLSDALMGRQEIKLEVKGPQDEVVAALQNIPGVNSVSVKTGFGGQNPTYVVSAEKERDVRESVFYVMAQKGFPILEMKSSYMSLEDIFLELVTEEPATEPTGEVQKG